MADYHILSGDKCGNSFTVVFHIAVPDQNNEVGVNLRTALSEHQGGSVVSLVPAGRLGAGEQSALDNGELYEHPWRYHTHPGLTLTQKRDELDARFASFSTSIVSILENRLGYWGYGRDVP